MRLCSFGDGAQVLHSSLSRCITQSTAGTLALPSCWLEKDLVLRLPTA